MVWIGTWIGALTLLVPLLLGFALPGSALQTYTNAQEGYRLLRPSQWLKLADPVGADAVFYDPSHPSETVSVVINALPPGSSPDQVATLWQDPQHWGHNLIEQVFAPPGSGREAQLLEARTERVNGQSYGVLEFTITFPLSINSSEDPIMRHNLARFTLWQEQIYSLNVSAPDGRWPQQRILFEQVASSFRVGP